MKNYISNTTDCLDWSVDMVQEVHPITGENLPFYATMRSDNNQILKTGLSSQYRPIQNSEIKNLAEKLSSEFDIKTEKVEIIDGGKKVIIQVTSGEAQIGHALLGGKPDTVALRTTFLHDNTGGGGLKFTPSPFRLVCHNQLAVISSLKSGYIRDVVTRSICHNSKGIFQLGQILNTAETIHRDGLLAVETFNNMARTKLNNFDIKDIIENMIRDQIFEEKCKEEIEKLIFDADSGQSDPFSVWGVYNGVTRFNDHFSSRKNPTTNNLVFGSLAKKNSLAIDHLLQYVQA